MDKASGPRRRRIGRIVAAVLGGLAALLTLLPLILRGPVARWVVRQASSSLCGKIEISGGHLGWAATWALLSGRPFELVLENVKIDGPNGTTVFAAARFETTLEMHFRPSRLILSRLLMAQGRWELALLPNETGLFDAFRSIPEAGRAACLDPNARPKARKHQGSSGLIAIRDVQFEDVDVDLRFPTWELELARTNAIGSLSAGGNGPPLLFEARDVIAAAGALRIGRRGEAWTARVPFDGVSIARVAVAPEAASDLVLEVASADTGRARLSGRAAFLNIFPLKAGQQPPGVPGLDADVRWTAFGGALREMDATFRPQGAWATHLDGDLRASVKGPFTALAGSLQIEGAATRLTASVAHGAADLSIAFAGLETGWMLDPALRPLLGGLLHGHFHATARLWPTLAGIEAEIPDADLRLERRHAPSGPRRFQLRIGKGGGPDGAADTLYASVASVRLADAELRLDGLRADWTGLSARIDAHVAFATPAQRSDVGSARRERSLVAAHGTLAVAALEDWIPGGAVSGPLRLAAIAEGTIDRVAFGLSFPPPGTVGVLGQRFALPRRLDAVLTADAGLSVPRFQLRRLGGGAIEVGGRVGGEGKLAATVGVRDYPVAAIPGLPRDKLPGPLTGTLAAELTLGGALDRPTAEGTIDVGALALGRRPIGDVETSLRLGGERGQVDATIDPGITVHARVRRRPRPSLEATVTIRDRPLGPWLPVPLAGAPLAVSGEVKVGYRADLLSGEGTLSFSGPGLNGVALTAEAQGLDAHARLKGEIDVARWPQLWSRAFKSAQGTLAFDLALAPGLGGSTAAPVRPHLGGSLRVARALTVRSAGWPAPIAVEPGGQIALDGDAVTVSGLTVITPGLRGGLGGHATLDLDDLERTKLALTLGAELDAAAFPVRLPDGVVAHGRAAIDAQISGTLGATPGPRIDGQARLDGLTVQLSPTTPAARASGVVEAHGDTLRTDTLRVDIAGVGAVTIGRAGAPATAGLASLSPFRLGRVDVPFAGQDLRIGDPSSKLYLPDLDADLRLSGDGRGELRISGQVATAGGSYDSSRGGKQQPSSAEKPRASGAWYRALPPHLTLDLELHGTNKGMRVAVPVLPDVTVDFQCHLLATNRAATWSGHLRGDGTYARAAVAVADWFSDNDLRKCQFTK